METLQDTIEAFAIQTQVKWHPEMYGNYNSESQGNIGATEWLYIFIAILMLYIIGAAIIGSIKKSKK